MLPSPPPASGTLSIGINSGHIPPDSTLGLELGGQSRFFLRLEQKVSEKQAITRIVDLKDLRGVSLPGKPTPDGKPTRDFYTVNDAKIRDAIKRAAKLLHDEDKKTPGSYDTPLFEDAVIYVPESAPIHILHEIGLTALEAAEYVDKLYPLYQCCPWN